MKLEQFGDRLLSNAELQAALRSLVVRSAQHEFRDLKRVPVEPVNWKISLFVGSVLCKIDTLRTKESALRIANGCLTSDDSSKEEREAARVILERLSNYPTVDLAIKREVLDESRDHLPIDFWVETSVRRAEQTEMLPQHQEGFLLNGFQRKFWTAAKENDWLSVSAPTSTGKSFIVQKWIESEVLGKNEVSIVYLAPTRALVHEVERKLRQSLGGPDSGVDVLTIPSAIADSTSAKKVLVLTQERYQILLSRTDPSFRPYLVMVDEAQKIGEGARGVLLQHVLDETVRKNPSAKVFLASPYSSNPEVLNSSAPAHARKDSVRSFDVVVSQNLLWASTVPGRQKLCNVYAIHEGDPLLVGTLTLRSIPKGPKRLAYIASEMGGSGGNVVYVNGGKEAETIAGLLADVSNVEPNEELRALSELAERAVHPKFPLTDTVLKGVAFHYGAMPLLLRLEIERCFKEGHLKYLVCTSTLVEGVNLPCRNLFVRGPKRGPGKPMTMADFWNLAGRAGRMGMEFQGNIICIDPTEDVWEGGVPRTRSQSEINTPTADLDTRTMDLARLVSRQLTKKDDASHLVALMNYAFMDLRNNPERSPFANPSTESHTVVASFLARFANGSVPFELIAKNPSVALDGMERLLSFFAKVEIPMDELIPLPAEASGAAIGAYVRILKIINQTLAPGMFVNEAHVLATAIISVHWMKGHSLPKLIDAYRNRKSAPKPPKPWPTDIRHVMKQVEEVARYHVPRLVTCYMDILRHHASNANLSAKDKETLDEVPVQLHEFMEFGVEVKTQLSLMNLGLTRTTVVEVFGLMTNDNMSTAQCLTWLASRDLDKLSLPVLVVREIRRVLEERGVVALKANA